MPPATTAALTLNNGVTMPALGLGVFQSPPQETAAAVEAALRNGYRLIDTAAAYGNEREVGEAVRASGLDRSEVFLETKIWISDYGSAPKTEPFVCVRAAPLAREARAHDADGRPDEAGGSFKEA
jgi:diketogulonate reductase-like aldo/keto reductase